jgi:hypothetical protein
MAAMVGLAVSAVCCCVGLWVRKSKEQARQLQMEQELEDMITRQRGIKHDIGVLQRMEDGLNGEAYNKLRKLKDQMELVEQGKDLVSTMRKHAPKPEGVIGNISRGGAARRVAPETRLPMKTDDLDDNDEMAPDLQRMRKKEGKPKNRKRGKSEKKKKKRKTKRRTKSRSQIKTPGNSDDEVSAASSGKLDESRETLESSTASGSAPVAIDTSRLSNANAERVAKETGDANHSERAQGKPEQAEREQEEREQAEHEQAEHEEAKREQAEHEEAKREQAERELCEKAAIAASAKKKAEDEAAAMASAVSAVRNIWTPHAAQIKVYNSYFERLSRGKEAVKGRDAASFLSESQLEKGALRDIWNLSDPNKTGSLDKPGFFMCLRFIALVQSGHSCNHETFQQHATSEEIPVPFFKWKPNATQMPGYLALFTEVDANGDGSIKGKEIGSFLKSSGVSKDVLRLAWKLADTEAPKGSLDQEGFFICLRYIALAQSGKEVSVNSFDDNANNADIPLPTFSSVKSSASAAPRQETLGASIQDTVPEVKPSSVGDETEVHESGDPTHGPSEVREVGE